MSYKKIYLDTCIIRDCLKRRNDDSIILMRKIGEKKIECVTGVYTTLELLDIEQDFEYFRKKDRQGFELNTILRMRHTKDLNSSELKDISDNLMNFFKEHNYIKTVSLVGEGWNWALIIALKSNIESSDALHLATALGEKCDLLITNDSHFIKETKKFIQRTNRKLKICNPKEAEKLID